jgi:hypothetical protein
MIEHAIGTKHFYAAINIYLNAHQYSTATYKDLIAAFEQVTFITEWQEVLGNQQQTVMWGLKSARVLRRLLPSILLSSRHG